MAQELISKRIAVIGGGPAGCICAKFLLDEGFSITIFDKGELLKTLLPTGGGKCNLAFAEYDFKELAKNYPRGEKFLYSVFSRFGTSDTVEFFKSIGVETYVREDNRIFPTSNSSADVRDKFLRVLKGVKYIREKVTNILPPATASPVLSPPLVGMSEGVNSYKIFTDKGEYLFDNVVVATGGKSYEILKNLDINIIPPTKSLVGLITKDDYSGLSGVSLKNVKCAKFSGDILFTHKGISGPLVYTLSSIDARKEFPYQLEFEFIDQKLNPQEFLDKNSHKEIKNLLGQFVPKSFAEFYLKSLGLNSETMCHKIDGKTRDLIFNNLKNYKITVTGKIPDSEVVTCGGVDLKEINPKTLASKKYSGLYFCGEVLDIDGFCGGFNLQNCWATGYVVSQSIIEKFI